MEEILEKAAGMLEKVVRVSVNVELGIWIIERESVGS